MIILLKIYLISVAYMMLYYYVINYKWIKERYKKETTCRFFTRMVQIFFPVINTFFAICIWLVNIPITKFNLFNYFKFLIFVHLLITLDHFILKQLIIIKNF